VSQRLSSFFTGNATLRDLARTSQQLAALDRLFREAIPPSLASASRVIGVERHVLKVGAENSAVAAKLRQLAPQILLRLQEDNAKVTGILVKVQVGRPQAKPTRAARVLSQTGRQQIEELASNLADSPLKSALLRLIRRQTPP
jgi:hypothetical protein